MTIYKRNPGGFTRRSAPSMPPPPGRRPNISRNYIGRNNSISDIDKLFDRIDRLEPNEEADIYYKTLRNNLDEFTKDEMHDLNFLERKRSTIFPWMMISMIISVIISLFILSILSLKPDSNKISPPSIEKEITEKVDTNNGSLKQL